MRRTGTDRTQPDYLRYRRAPPVVVSLAFAAAVPAAVYLLTHPAVAAGALLVGVTIATVIRRRAEEVTGRQHATGIRRWLPER